MDATALFERILKAVDDKAYLTPVTSVEPGQRGAIGRIRDAMQDESLPIGELRKRILAEHEAGHIDRVHMLSALHVVAASPRVRDFDEAARLCGEQEQAALDLGGPHLDANLASVSRHRGVLAFLAGQPMVALDHFTAALERQRTPENVGNVLATLLKLGELEEAEALLAQVARAADPAFHEELIARIDDDPDLASLRDANPFSMPFDLSEVS